MAGHQKLRKAYRRLDKKKANEISTIPGILGFPINGVNTVEVRNRNGYVYVRLRDNQSEVVQAFNTNVSPVYGLPVLIARDKINKSRYTVLSRDIGRYENWGTSSPFLPRHGAQHSFDPTAVGGDIVWVYNRQFMPLNVYPSGSYGSMSVMISPATYYRNGSWRYAGETGTASFAGYKPTGTSARMVLVSLDGADNPQLTPGVFFASTLTGTNQIFSYIPQIPTSDSIPIAAIRLVSGTSIINWDNIYDVRPFFMASGFQATGTSGHIIADEGTPLTVRPTLNFVGTNVWAQDDAGNTRTNVIISGTSAGGSIPTYPAIYDNSIFKATGTALVFQDNLSVVVTGTTAYINSTGGSTGSSGSTIYTHWDVLAPPTSPSAYDDEFSNSIFATGSWSEVDPNNHMTITEGDQRLILTADSSSDGVTGIYFTIPDTYYSFMTRVSLSVPLPTTGKYHAGLAVWVAPTGTSSALKTFGPYYNVDTVEQGIGYGSFSAYGTFTSVSLISQSILSRVFYLRWRKYYSGGTVYAVEYSEDGIIWNIHNYNFGLGITPTKLGLFIYNGGTGYSLQANFQFFRYVGSDVGLTAPLAGRLMNVLS